jgi:hypothetical protein
MSPARVLLVPGLGNSGPEHWQSLWEIRTGYLRVEQRDWDTPVLSDWLAGLDSAARNAGGPIVLVAHSLGCALVAHWASSGRADVRGALLVAPADVDSDLHTPAEVRSFAPMPLEPLPFAATVVASRTDPYVSFQRAEQFARAWRATFVDAGRLGHLNADSGLGEWPEGQRLIAAWTA